MRGDFEKQCEKVSHHFEMFDFGVASDSEVIAFFMLLKGHLLLSLPGKMPAVRLAWLLDTLASCQVTFSDQEATVHKGTDLDVDTGQHLMRQLQ